MKLLIHYNNIGMIRFYYLIQIIDLLNIYLSMIYLFFTHLYFSNLDV